MRTISNIQATLKMYETIKGFSFSVSFMLSTVNKRLRHQWLSPILKGGAKNIVPTDIHQFIALLLLELFFASILSSVLVNCKSANQL